jgi:hypothetical protein
MHIIDSLFIGHSHLREREWLIATDCVGGLTALPDENLESVPASLQHELAYHEISGRRQLRMIEATEVYLFYPQLLEQPGGAPGWNDPVYLYGSLYGPWPEVAGTNEAHIGVEGQLTVTRADLLDGLVRGAEYAFHYSRPGGESGPDARCFNLILPGDSENEIRRGAGIILTYPLLPATLITTDVSNEIVVSQLLYDLLSALKEDLIREKIGHPLREWTLPVPSRLTLEQELQSQGYTIKGEKAVRKTASGEGFKGFLTSVFGALMSEEVDLPPEGEVDEYFDLARRALQSLPGWPSPCGLALRECIKPAPARQRARPRPSPQIKTPRISSPPPPIATPQARPASGSPGEVPDWMRDFMTVHRRPNAPPSKLTLTTPLTPQRPQSFSGPEWMNDFEQSTPMKKTDEKPPQTSAGKTPDWMKDFE